MTYQVDLHPGTVDVEAATMDRAAQVVFDSNPHLQKVTVTRHWPKKESATFVKDPNGRAVEEVSHPGKAPPS